MDLKNYLVQKSPAILLGAGIFGFVSAIVATAKVAPKAQEKLDALEENASLVDKAKTILPDYIPVIGAAMVSTGFILISAKIVNHRFAALGMLYSLSEKQLIKLQETVLDEVGEKKAEEIRHKSTTPGIEIPEEIMDLDDGSVLFFDNYTGRYFRRRSVEVIRKCVNDTNEQAIGEGWASVNDFYYALGLPPIENGSDIGWQPEKGASDDGLLVADLDSHMVNDIPVVVITYRFKPKYWTPY